MRSNDYFDMSNVTYQLKSIIEEIIEQCDNIEIFNDLSSHPHTKIMQKLHDAQNAARSVINNLYAVGHIDKEAANRVVNELETTAKMLTSIGKMWTKIDQFEDLLKLFDTRMQRFNEWQMMRKD